MCQNTIFKPNALAIIYFVGFFLGVQLFMLPFIYILNIDLENPYFTMFTYIFSFTSPILAYYFLEMKPKNQKYEWNWQLSSPKSYLLIFSLLFSMILICEFVVELIPTEGYILGSWYKLIEGSFSSLANSPFVLIILTSFCAPILEELVFRGILLRALLNYNISPYICICISSFAFGIIHANPWQFVGASLLGFVIGLVYWKTNSLSNAILLHFVNNLIAVLFMLYVSNKGICETMSWDWIFLLPISLFVFVVSFLLFVKEKTHSK